MTELKFPKASVFRTFTLQTDLIDPPVIKLELTPAGGADTFRRALEIAPSIEGESDVLKMPPSSQRKLLESFVDLAAVVSKHVIGWDLTLDGKPIPCTDEEKTKWLEPLLWEIVEPEPEAMGLDPGDDDKKKRKELWLWSALMDVITERRNFLKN